jgi:hypothetical protein
VVGLVQCSFAIALTPMAMGLAWRLTLGIGNSSGRGRTSTGESARGSTTGAPARRRARNTRPFAGLRRTDSGPITPWTDDDDNFMAGSGGINFTAWETFPRDRVLIAPTETPRHGAREFE